MQGDADEFLIPAEDRDDHQERPVLDPSKFLMPPRREAAVQNLFTGGPSMSEAYVKAGFLSGANASAFYRLPDVAARIEYIARDIYEALRANIARAHCATIYDEALAMAEAEEVRMCALRLNRPGAALGAIILKARISGLLKSDEDGPGLPMGDMTIDQVEKYRVTFGRKLRVVQDLIAERESRGTEEPGALVPGNLPGSRH